LHVPPLGSSERANVNFLVNPPAAIPVLPAPAVPAAVVTVKPAVTVKPLIAIIALAVIAVMVPVRAAVPVSIVVTVTVTVSVSVCHILLQNLG
jgi:hypothetical protein